MNTLLLIILSTVIVSLFSLIGISIFLIKKKLSDKILFSLIALSAGTLIGGAFLHLIPEAIETSNNNSGILIYVIIGFCLFFIIEKTLHWHHCNCDKEHKHETIKKKSLPYMNLIGDGLHNFIDGIIIGIAYLSDIRIGIVTTIVILAHEIPQEISDFGVLIYGKFSVNKALLFNLLSASVAIIGGVITYFLASLIEKLTPLLLAIAAGGFIYIAASDLIPEINNQQTKAVKPAIIYFLIFIIGIIFMYLIKMFGGV
ncbi:MAG: ZIP family metal transporter [archaeon]